MKTTKLILVTVAFFSSSIFAETVIPKGVGCDTDSGECFIILEKPFVSKICGGPNNQLRVDANKPGSKNQYSAALAAFMAGKNLRLDQLFA